MDNPLWITAAAGGRLLRGGRGRLCGGSVNAGTKMQTRTGRVRKASRGKCERGRGSANADGAGAEVFAGDGCSQGRLSAPWPRFHGVDRADVYIIIHVRACCCGECALNPPTAQHIPRRRSAPAPAQRRALPEHFLTPSPRRRTPAGCAMHSSPPSQHIPRRRPPLAPAQRRALPGHFLTPFPRTSAPPPRDDARPPTSPPIPRRRSAPVPAQRRALPAHFRSLPAPTHARRLRDAFFADPTTHFPPKICSRPSTATRPSPALLPHPRSADAHPPTSQHIPRRKPAPAPAAPRCLSFRSASGTKKRHRTVDVRCRMFRSTVVAVGHLGW